jgi:hypothetical protein
MKLFIAALVAGLVVSSAIAQEILVTITTPDGKVINAKTTVGQSFEVEQRAGGKWGLVISPSGGADQPLPPDPIRPAPPAPQPTDQSTPLQKAARAYVLAVADAQRKVAASVRSGQVRTKLDAITLQNQLRDQVRKDYAAALDSAVASYLDQAGNIIDAASYAAALEAAVLGIGQ